jgi:hypothetical protein
MIRADPPPPGALNLQTPPIPSIQMTSPVEESDERIRIHIFVGSREPNGYGLYGLSKRVYIFRGAGHSGPFSAFLDGDVPESELKKVFKTGESPSIEIVC